MFVIYCFVPTQISFEICSKQLSTMRNRFFILPQPEKLYFNEFLRLYVSTFDILQTNIQKQF